MRRDLLSFLFWREIAGGRQKQEEGKNQNNTQHTSHITARKQQHTMMKASLRILVVIFPFLLFCCIPPDLVTLAAADESARVPQRRRQCSSSTIHSTSSPDRDSSWLENEIANLPFPALSSSSPLVDAVLSFFQHTVDDDVNDIHGHDTADTVGGGSGDNDKNNNLLRIIRSESASIQPFLLYTRRLLHRYPELMYRERKTSLIIQRLLNEMGIENYSVGWARNIHSASRRSCDEKENEDHDYGDNDVDDDEDDDGGGHGIVVDIGSGEAPCILLRADMDALPIVEKTPLPPDLRGKNDGQGDHHNGNNNNDALLFHSQHHGKMHACGHDAHMTMLLGATYLLKTLQQEHAFPGTIRIIFQPAEEGGAGAKRMSEEGVLTLHPPPSYAFALHVWPTLPTGEIGVRSGPMLGAADTFDLVIEGVGGHAAFPHLTKDPVVACAAVIMNLQSLVSRSLNPLESGVVSVTGVDANGGAHNVIPSRTILRGTIRALSDETLLELKEGLVRVAESTVQAHGCRIVSTIFAKDHYPVTMNDAALFPLAARVASLVSETGAYTPIDPTLGAEDFAFIAQGVPSAFFFLGQGGKQEDTRDADEDIIVCGECGSNVRKVPTNLGLHHPEFNLDEDILPKGVELFVNLALRALQELSR